MFKITFPEFNELKVLQKQYDIVIELVDVLVDQGSIVPSLAPDAVKYRVGSINYNRLGELISMLVDHLDMLSGDRGAYECYVDGEDYEIVNGKLSVYAEIADITQAQEYYAELEEQYPNGYDSNATETMWQTAKGRYTTVTERMPVEVV